MLRPRYYPNSLPANDTIPGLRVSGVSLFFFLILTSRLEHESPNSDQQLLTRWPYVIWVAWFSVVTPECVPLLAPVGRGGGSGRAESSVGPWRSASQTSSKGGAGQAGMDPGSLVTLIHPVYVGFKFYISTSSF